MIQARVAGLARRGRAPRPPRTRAGASVRRRPRARPRRDRRTGDCGPGRDRRPSCERKLRGGVKRVDPSPLDPGVSSQQMDSAQPRAAEAAVPVDDNKRMMLFAGRANPALAAAIAERARRGARRGHAQDLLGRRVLLPLRRVGPRRGRLHRPVHVRQPGDRRPHERRADGAAAPDRRRRRRVGAPRDRRHAVVRLLAPGQEVRAARADQRAAGGPHARGRRRRPRAGGRPARRPDPGLLHEAARPRDRACT